MSFTLKTVSEFSWRVPLVATSNDGFYGADSWQALITAHSHPDVPDSSAILSAADACRMNEWIETYLLGKDLTKVLDMAPTTLNLASYLATTFGTMCEGLAAVTVTFQQAGETTRAELVRS